MPPIESPLTHASIEAEGEAGTSLTALRVPENLSNYSEIGQTPICFGFNRQTYVLFLFPMTHLTSRDSTFHL